MMEDQEALKAGVERLRRQQKAAAETMRRHCKKHGGEALDVTQEHSINAVCELYCNLHSTLCDDEYSVSLLHCTEEETAADE